MQSKAAVTKDAMNGGSVQLRANRHKRCSEQWFTELQTTRQKLLRVGDKNLE